MNSFPGTDLKANPHINSKLCAWKKNYHSLSAILSRTGVGFNTRGTHMIDCEDDAWDQIVKLDPNARQIRYKSWPYYEAWVEIFGKDRANGKCAEDLLDAHNATGGGDMSSSHIGTGDNYELNTDDISEKESEGDNSSHGHKSAQVKKKLKMKRKMSEEMETVCEIIRDIGDKIDARLANLALRVGYEFDLGNSKNDAFNLLGGITWLTLEQRFDVSEMLSNDVFKLEVFMGLPAKAIPHYVERLLVMKG